jgi:hypothetical protein
MRKGGLLHDDPVAPLPLPSFEESNSCMLESGALKAADLRTLVEWLMFRETSPGLVEAFLRLRPACSVTALSLLETVRLVLEAAPSGERGRAANFLLQWVTLRFTQDFRQDDSLWSKLLSVVSSDPNFNELKFEILRCKVLEEAKVRSIHIWCLPSTSQLLP